jgi:hypothetical protein
MLVDERKVLRSMSRIEECRRTKQTRVVKMDKRPGRPCAAYWRLSLNRGAGWVAGPSVNALKSD